MELFKTEILRKEYKEFANKLLPAVLESGYCNISTCKYHKKTDMFCNLCRAAICKNCKKFNLSKDLLLSKATPEVVDYLHNFICDFLNLSDQSLKTYFPDIKIVKLEKVEYTKRGKSEKNRSQTVNQVLPSGLRKGFYQNGRFKRRFFY